MQSQTSNEEIEERIERNREVDKDWHKARQFPTTVIGRVRLRNMRRFFHHVGINVQIPMNSAAFTDAYCRAFGKTEPDVFDDAKVDRREI